MTMRAGTSNRASLNMASNASNSVGSISENTLSSDRHNLQLAALMHSDGKILDILDTAGTLFVLTSTRRLYALGEKTMDEVEKPEPADGERVNLKINQKLIAYNGKLVV